MTWTFVRAHEELRRARDPYKGRPIARNTRVVLRKGDIDAPVIIAIQYHATDIIKLHADGSHEICTGWTTMSTMARLRDFGGIYAWRVRLPSFNGRRPAPERVLALSGRVPFDGLNGYLRVLPDGTVDMASVRPTRVKIIENVKATNAARRKAALLDKHVRVQRRLGRQLVGAAGVWGARRWLQANLDRPLDEVDFKNAPADGDLRIDDWKPIHYAALVDAATDIQLLEIPR